MCVSAIVNCHKPVNETIQQILYNTANCQGTPTRTIQPDLYDPTSPTYCYKWVDFWVHNICPDATDLELDLSRFVPKLLKKEPEMFTSESIVWTAIFEYKRYLIMKKNFPKLELAPSPLVDEVWHMHILDTRQYMKDCDRIFGFYVHHAPSFGDSEEEKDHMGDRYKQTLMIYEEVFGESPSEWVWPRINSADCNGCNGACTAPAASCFYPECCS
jgi:hypothetical protein